MVAFSCLLYDKIVIACAAGSVYLYDCPYERYIPIYLIVGGCFGFVKNISSIVQRIRNKRENRDDDNAKTNPFDGVLNCFLLAWFISGLTNYSFCANFLSVPRLFLCLPSPPISVGRGVVFWGLYVCECVRVSWHIPKSLLAQCLKNQCMEFHQFHGVVEAKDEQVRF